jgi:transposase
MTVRAHHTQEPVDLRVLSGNARISKQPGTPAHARLHFTPTYSSWLNQVEIWFARIECDVIARGVFTSVKDLAQKTHALHPHLLEERATLPMEILRRQEAYQSS